MNVEFKSIILSSTPTLDTNIYASGDQLGNLKTLSSVMDNDGGTAKLISVSVLDKAKQKSSLDILFFSSSPTVASSDNGALDISDAEMASKFLGKVSVASADYIDLNANSVVSYNNLKLLLKSAAGTKDIYYILRSAGTPTFAASDLVLTFGFAQD